MWEGLKLSVMVSKQFIVWLSKLKVVHVTNQVSNVYLKVLPHTAMDFRKRRVFYQKSIAVQG